MEDHPYIMVGLNHSKKKFMYIYILLFYFEISKNKIEFSYLGHVQDTIKHGMGNKVICTQSLNRHNTKSLESPFLLFSNNFRLNPFHLGDDIY